MSHKMHTPSMGANSVVSHMAPREIARILPQMHPTKVARTLQQIPPPKAARAMNLMGNEVGRNVAKKMEPGALAKVLVQAHPQDRTQVRALVSEVLTRRQAAKLVREVVRSNPKEATRLLVNRPDAAKLVKKIGPEARVEIVTGARLQDRNQVRELVFGSGRLRQRVTVYREVAKNNQRAADNVWEKVQAWATAHLAKRLERGRAEVVKEMKEAAEAARSLESGNAKTMGEISARLQSASLARALEKIQPPLKATEVLQRTNDTKAISALGMMEPTAAARLVQEGNEKFMVSILERMPSKQVVSVFEELRKIDPMLADKRFGAMNMNARVDVMKTMNVRNPEVAVAMWERMDTATTIEISQRLPLER